MDKERQYLDRLIELLRLEIPVEKVEGSVEEVWMKYDCSDIGFGTGNIKILSACDEALARARSFNDQAIIAELTELRKRKALRLAKREMDLARARVHKKAAKFGLRETLEFLAIAEATLNDIGSSQEEFHKLVEICKRSDEDFGVMQDDDLLNFLHDIEPF